MAEEASLIPVRRVEEMILQIRGQKVLLDADLATLYGVTTKRLNEQVRRNSERFPLDFMFQLTQEEAERLRSHFATLETGRGRHRKYLPYAFTEHGAIMAASVLNSPRAIDVSVAVVRAFVRLRLMLASNADLARKLAALEKKYDAQFKVVFDAIRQLMIPPAPKRRKLGFMPKEE
jgi:hypothetical protein